MIIRQGLDRMWKWRYVACGFHRLREYSGR